VLTVFDAGRHRAQAAQAHAQYDEQVADYRNAVLTAYQEVEDNVAALHRLEQESILNRRTVASVLLVKAPGGGWRSAPLGRIDASAEAYATRTN
jgi:hypothetical protein